MAEFQEVMKQRDRMCKHYLLTDRNCENCPLDKARKSTILQCFRYIAEYYQEAENVIMSWAAEHPEPVYPTWGEWLYGLDLIKKATATFTEYKPGVISTNTKEVSVLTDKGDQPIPANIAEQFGIEPKEG